MKYLLTILLILTSFLMAVSQAFNYAPVLIAPSQYAMPWQSSDGDNTGVMLGDGSNERINYFRQLPLTSVNISTLSRYMFDDDDGLEIAFSEATWLDTDFVETYVVGIDENSSDPVIYPGLLVGVMQTENGAVMILEDSPDRSTIVMSLPGNTPQYDHEQANRQVPAGPGRVDTVYQLVTERIFTSDTVYLSETITVDGDVDTVFVNRTTTERIFTHDTIFSVNESFITRSDTLYMLPGQFAKDSELILSTENLELKELLAYPNPAESTLTISSHTTRPSTLRIYDMAGEVVKTAQVSTGFNDTEINVGDLSAGIYVVMVLSQNERSKTRKVIVE